MKNINHIVHKTASQLNLPPEEVREVMMGYWEDIYYKILKGETTAVTIRHVGTFTISRFKLNNFIQKMIDKIRRVAVMENYDLKQAVLDDSYRKLHRALERRTEIAEMFHVAQKAKRNGIKRLSDSRKKRDTERG